MRVIFAGTPAAAVPSLQKLLDVGRHEVIAVLTRPPRPAGRGRHLTPSPVAQVAEQAQIPVLTPSRLGDPELLAQLRHLGPDCCPVVAYGGLVPPAALAIPGHGWVNLHFSLLPAWRGAAPVQHALLAGDEITGASTFRLEEGLDTGPVFGVLTEPIKPTDTAGDVLDRLAVAGAELLLATLDGIEAGQLQPVPQPGDGISLAPKLTVADARVDWSAPATATGRRIRACTPAPGAWTTFRGQRLRLGPVSPTGTAGPRSVGSPPPGELALVDGQVQIGTGTEPVIASWVQPAGKRPMPATDWARGVRLSVGERCA